MPTRKEKEREFHDRLRSNSFGQRWSPELEKVISSDPLWANMKYYAVERKSRNEVFNWFARNCDGKVALDYCCGNGDDSFVMYRHGAKKVTGIDISEVSVGNCQQRAKREKVESTVSFVNMDAENLTFDNNTFDIISEYGALHHLNLEKAYSEFARTLKPEGKCICQEALRHNPLIHYYRKRTPDLRTEWEVEHILGKREIEYARKFFNKVEFLGFFHLAALAAVPLRTSPGFYSILSILDKLDDVLLKLPILRWQAWQVVFILSEPKKH